MSNIKNLIEKTFLNNEKISNTINILSDIQNNLVKNYSNPVFNSKDKNKLNALEDFRNDFRANQTGTQIGKNYPGSNCDSVLEMLWPDILDQIFKQ